MCTEQKIIASLQKIALNGETGLKRAVAREILDHADTDGEARSFISDVLRYGCVSGTVGSLIYYVDTHRFYDRHYDDIETLRIDTEESLGTPLRIDGDAKNFFAWFAFEETLREIANGLGIG